MPGTGGLRVIRPSERVPDVSSGPMRRAAGVSQSLVGAEKIWFGYVELEAGATSAVHHHGDAESGIYVISGHARFLAGRGLQEAHEAGPGDFVWVPPHVVHVEMNAGDREPVRMVVARSTQDTLVFNVAAPAGWMPPARP